MKSFENSYILRHLPTHDLLKTIRRIGEYKGKQDLYREQSPQLLDTLQHVAKIQSVESSNRIEGITAPLDRIKKIADQKTTPKNRSEQEIAGYRDVLDMIHTNFENIPFTTGVVLQFHKTLYQYHSDDGGHWKRTNNQIIERAPDGSRVIRFEPVPSYLTAEYMEILHRDFNEMWDAREVDPLLLIPAYVLDFLCIHPFSDGNGRMARLLSLLLLYKAGYEVGRYISLEKIVEDTRKSYYDTLWTCSQGWHEGGHLILPWWEYFNGVMLLTAYKEFESRTGVITTARGAKTSLVLDTINSFEGEFSTKDIQDRCPGVGIDMIRRILDRERKAGHLESLGRGRDAKWKKASVIS